MEVHVLHLGEIIYRQVLGDQPVTIGRSRHNEIVLLYSDVSSHHAIISRQSDRVVLQDLQSSNGTFLNSERLSRPAILSVGDRIRLGNTATLHIAQSAPIPRPSMQLERVDGGLVWPMRAARLVIPSSDETALVVDESGEVWLEEDGVEQHPVALDTAFVVGGVAYVLRSGALLTAETVQVTPSGVPYRLAVSLDEGEATLSDTRSGQVCRYQTDNRVALLYALAQRWHTDAPGAGQGWLDDESLASAIWGRQRHQQTANNLNVLIFRIRKKATGAGLSGMFLQKRRSRMRLRVNGVEV
ncbi:MAG: hypothetical protein ACI8RZ_001860 [Myxococcota bacterium]|jgi:hypothetical protein